MKIQFIFSYSGNLPPHFQPLTSNVYRRLILNKLHSDFWIFPQMNYTIEWYPLIIRFVSYSFLFNYR